MGAKLGGGGAIADINMTPLIDIVLVVLIIMMVNIPIQIEKLGVKLPGKVENRPITDVPPDQLVLMAYADGSFALNRAAISEDAIFGEITRRLRSKEKKIVFVDAHPELTWERVMDAVDLASEAGAATVSLARMKESGPPDPTSAYEGALPPGLILGSPRVAGEMLETTADARLRPALPSWEACYAEALTRAPKLTGRIVVQVDVGPEGEIMAVEISADTAGDADLAACLSARASELRFDPLGFQKTARINYPFLLSPG